MDLLSFTLFFFLIFIVVLARTTATERKRKVGGDAGNLPPGPRPLPIIGNVHLLLFRLPHHVMHELSERHGPLIHLRLGELSLVVASSTEAAREILTTHDLAFSDRPQIPAMSTYSYDGRDLVFAPYGDHWRKLRRICVHQLLSSKRVASFAPGRVEEISRFITSLRAAAPGVVNLSRMLRDLNMDMLGRAIIGGRCRHRDDAVSLARDTIDALAGMELADLFPSSSLLRRLTNPRRRKALEKMERVMNSILLDRREKPKKEEGEEEDDLLEVLLRLHDEGELSTDSLKGVILDMFTAGSDTTATVLEWAMSELARNPPAMERAQAEVRGEMGSGRRESLTETDIHVRRECIIETDIHVRRECITETDIHGRLSYMRMVIKETLRLHPAGPFAARECRYRCNVLGYDVPAKARVLINLWAIGRDQRHWGDDAHEFRPERFTDGFVAGRDYRGNHYEFLPFGGGRRVCPGIAFGTATLELILANLLYHFDWVLPAGARPRDLDMTETFGGAARRKVNLLMCPVPIT